MKCAHLGSVVGALSDLFRTGLRGSRICRSAVTKTRKLGSHADQFRRDQSGLLRWIGDCVFYRLRDKIRLTAIPARRATMWLHVGKPDAAELSTSHVEAIHEDAVFRELNSVDIDDAEDGGSQNREHDVRTGRTGRADRFFLRLCRVNNAVGNMQWNRIDVHLVFMHLNRTENTVFDPYARANVKQFETWFGRTVRLTMAIYAPARHKGAMANDYTRSA